jgi:hypothetical protein
MINTGSQRISCSLLSKRDRADAIVLECRVRRYPNLAFQAAADTEPLAAGVMEPPAALCRALRNR